MTFIRLTNKHADRILWAGFVFAERHDDDRLRPSDTDPTLVYSPSGDEFTVTDSLDAIAAMLGGNHSEKPDSSTGPMPGADDGETRYVEVLCCTCDRRVPMEQAVKSHGWKFRCLRCNRSQPPGRHEGTPMGEQAPAEAKGEDVEYVTYLSIGNGTWKLSRKDYGPIADFGAANHAERLCKETAASLNRKPIGVEELSKVIGEFIDDNGSACLSLPQCRANLARRIAEATC